jgi:multicomponent Na+:H+ antiporter subunit D
VAAALAALGSTVAAYALVRVTYGVFGAAFFEAVPTVRTVLLAAAAASVVAGGVLALRATDVRRLLAYSSVSQFGLVALGVGLASPTALAGALVALVGHAVAKGGLFVAAGTFDRSYGVRSVADCAGLARRTPLGAFAVVALAVSLVGLPPTVGFAGKWLLALGAVETGQWAVAAVVVLSTLLSLAYAGRLVERLYLDESSVDGTVAADGGLPARPDPLGLSFVVASAALVVALGLGAGALTDWFGPVVEGWL